METQTQELTVDRPLHPRDKLAQEFPLDRFNRNKLIQQLTSPACLIQTYNPVRNWCINQRQNLSNLRDPVEKPLAWHPFIDKQPNRWLIRPAQACQWPHKPGSNYEISFGIDALRLGLKLSTKEKGKIKFPYIHFDQSTTNNKIPEQLRKHGVAKVMIFYIRPWQLKQLEKLLSQVPDNHS